MKDSLKDTSFLAAILTKPVRYTVLVALMLAVLALLFAPVLLPNNMPYVVSLVSFLNEYSGVVFTIFFLSFFLFIAQLISDMFSFYKQKQLVENIKKIQLDLYDDERAWNILLKLYYANGEPVHLVRSNQQVLLLESYFMIARTNNKILFYGYDFSKAEFPYVLQPEVEKHIRNKLNESNNA